MVSTVAILILCGLIFWLKKDKKKEVIIKNKIKQQQEKREEEQKIAAVIELHQKNWLQKAGELLHNENSGAFYNELNYALKNYLSIKLQLPIETINKKNITEQLDKKNIAVTAAVKLQQIMNDIELQLYTPFAEKEKMQELYDSAEDIIQILDAYKS